MRCYFFWTGVPEETVIGRAAELVELFVSALCLTAIHLLNKESRDRNVTDAKLRPIMHLAAAMGPVIPLWDIRDRFGDTNMLVSNMAQGEDLTATLGNNTVALMRGHGAVVTGNSVVSAVLVRVCCPVSPTTEAGSGVGKNAFKKRTADGSGSVPTGKNFPAIASGEGTLTVEV